MASMFAWKELPEAPTLDTGASFQRHDSDDRQQRRRRVRGQPRAHTRIPVVHAGVAGPPPVASSDGRPYASLDEAEKVQRRLTRSGYPSARIFVDESLRNAPRNDVANADVAEGNPNVVLISAPDRLSVVFELPPSHARCGHAGSRTSSTSTSDRCPARLCRSSGVRLKACT